MKFQRVLSLPLIVVLAGFACGCANTKKPIDPEAQKAYVDDGVDHYLADGDLEDTLNIAHGQYITDEDGNRIYTVNQVQDRHQTYYYVGDLRYARAAQASQDGFSSRVYDTAHPDDRRLSPGARARNGFQPGDHRFHSNNYLERLGRTARRSYPRATSTGSQNGNASSPSQSAPATSAPRPTTRVTRSPSPPKVTRERTRSTPGDTSSRTR